MTRQEQIAHTLARGWAEYRDRRMSREMRFWAALQEDIFGGCRNFPVTYARDCGPVTATIHDRT